MSGKYLLLNEIARRGRVADAGDLHGFAGIDGHTAIHLLFSLRDEGLVRFRQRRVGAVGVRLQGIKVTTNGERATRVLAGGK